MIEERKRKLEENDDDPNQQNKTPKITGIQEEKDPFLSFVLPPLDLGKRKDLKEIERMFCLLDGVGMRMNKRKAIKLCLRNAEKGHLLALGLKYLRGFGTNPNGQKAFQHFKKYQKQNAKSIEKALLEGKRDEEKEMEMGHCLYYLGLCHSNAIGTPSNKRVGMKYYNKSIQFGNAMASYKAACQYEDNFSAMNLDLEQHVKIIKQMLVLSASKNNSIALYKMAQKIRSSQYGLLGDSIKMYYRAAILGNVDSIKVILNAIEKKVSAVLDIESDMDTIMFFYLQLYHYHIENKLPFTAAKYSDLANQHVRKGLVEWKKEIHVFWRPSAELNKQILTFLLVSKHRNQSKMRECLCFVKGVAMNVVKSLCHLNNDPPKPVKNKQETNKND